MTPTRSVSFSDNTTGRGGDQAPAAVLGAIIAPFISVFDDERIWVRFRTQLENPPCWWESLCSAGITESPVSKGPFWVAPAEDNGDFVILGLGDEFTWTLDLDDMELDNISDLTDEESFIIDMLSSLAKDRGRCIIGRALQQCITATAADTAPIAGSSAPGSIGGPPGSASPDRLREHPAFSVLQGAVRVVADMQGWGADKVNEWATDREKIREAALAVRGCYHADRVDFYDAFSRIMRPETPMETMARLNATGISAEGEIHLPGSTTPA